MRPGNQQEEKWPSTQKLVIGFLENVRVPAPPQRGVPQPCCPGFVAGDKPSSAHPHCIISPNQHSHAVVFFFFFNYYPLRQSPVPLSCLPGLPRSLPRYQRLFLLMPWFQGCNHSEWSPINPAFSIRLARRSVHSCRNSNLYWKPHVHQYVSLCHSLSSRYTNVYSTGLSWCTLRLCPNTCLQKRGCH